METAMKTAEEVQSTHTGIRQVGRFRRALAERLGLKALDYPVPAHANTFWYSLGGITLAGLLITIVSGVLMAFWYNPSAAGANASIRQMMLQDGTARWLRGIHYWAAQIVLLTLVLHLLRVLVTGAYKHRREVNWLIGVGLLFTVAGFYYTGTVIKWDQEGYEALAHATELAKGLGVLGLPLTEGFAKGVPVFERIVFTHVSLLPLVFFLLVAIHLLLVKVLGVSALPGRDEVAAAAHGEGAHTFLQHGRKLVGYGLILLGTIAVLAVLLPPGIGRTPVEGIEVTKPPWAFIWLYPIEDRFGLTSSLLVTPLLVLAGLVLLPLLDRGHDTGLRKRWWVLSLAAVVVVVVFSLGIAGRLAGLTSHIGM